MAQRDDYGGTPDDMSPGDQDAGTYRDSAGLPTPNTGDNLAGNPPLSGGPGAQEAGTFRV